MKHDQPGQRFTNLNRWWRSQNPGRTGRFLVLALGIILMVVGFALGLIPGVPGIVLGIVGAGIFATQFLWAARALDRLESGIRRLIGKRRPMTANHRD